MTVLALGSSECEALENNRQKEHEDKSASWQGRVVHWGNHPTPKITLCSNVVSGGIKDYFDTEKKKQNEFDIALYQYHVRHNSKESKEHLEKAFEQMATGMIGIVIGVASFRLGPVAAAFSIYLCKERLWMGVEEFKKAMKARNIDLEKDVQFVTDAEDFRKNTEELMKSSILEPWKPLDTPNYHYDQTPHYTRPLETPNYHYNV